MSPALTFQVVWASSMVAHEINYLYVFNVISKIDYVGKLVRDE
ncbi:MAG: hypothetical protein Q7T51_04590 [Candidatus Moranbacteria bacterium]|nr:hypothetical protein [Candidatus Moranbacteria bacterium]